MHLFDIDIPGGQRFKESDVLTAGDKFFSFDTRQLKDHTQNTMKMLYLLACPSESDVHFYLYLLPFLFVTL